MKKYKEAEEAQKLMHIETIEIIYIYIGKKQRNEFLRIDIFSKKGIYIHILSCHPFGQNNMHCMQVLQCHYQE